MSQDFELSCPLPLSHSSKVLLGHGGGGRLTQQLIEQVFLPAFKNVFLEARHDGAVMDVGGVKLAFTTDAYVVRPLFFPGGDIGKLAVYGTVNDLAMCGARPQWLSASVILEEGLSMDTLCRVVESVRAAAEISHVQIVTGDTKVVEKGKGDELFVITAGIGVVPPGVVISPTQVRPGDAIIVSGDIGRHGMAIMAVREGLGFESPIESDCAPLADLVGGLLEAGVTIHCLRDLTRGGLASALVEISQAANTLVAIQETMIPVHEAVRGACEVLGLDPLYVANEGRCVAFVPEAETDKALAVLRRHPLGQGAAVIGHVESGEPVVTIKGVIGSTRIVEMISGEQLPRIC